MSDEKLLYDWEFTVKWLESVMEHTGAMDPLFRGTIRTPAIEKVFGRMLVIDAKLNEAAAHAHQLLLELRGLKE